MRSEVRKILIVTLSNLGDVVLTLPVFQSLREFYPKAELHGMVGPSARGVFEGDERVSKVIVFDKKMTWAEKIKLLWSVRRERYGLIVDLRYSLIGFLGGAKRRNRYFSFRRKSRHRGDRHLNALQGLVPKVGLDRSFLKPDAKDAWVEQVLGGKTPLGSQRFVIAAPGSKSDTKKWPAGHYARVLDRLVVEQGCRAVLVGDEADRADCAAVQRLMGREALDLSGRTRFGELCALISKASLVLTNDSAPLHLADALKVPVAAIFGPTDPGKYGPRGGHSAALQRALFCAPCEKAQCRYHHECMNELEPDEVYEKARRLLNDDLRLANLKILIVRLDRIGDVALSLPAIQAVRERFPDASVSLMVRPATRSLLQGHPWVDEVIPYFYENRGRHSSLLGNLRFIREVIRRRFDMAFILHPSFRSHAVPFLAGIPYRTGFKSHASFLLTKAIEDVRHEGQKHESEYALDVVRAFGIADPPERNFWLPVASVDTAAVERKLAEAGVSPHEPLIALHAGASCPSKRWPKERFAELGRRIAGEMACRIVLVGGREEAETARFLRDAIGGAAVDLAGQLELNELSALFKRCSVLVSNDSGPVHLAAGVGIRTLCIFGRNRKGLNAQRWKALGQGHRVVQKDVGCVVCLAHRCPIDFECLKAVSVGEIFRNLQEMLPSSAPVSKIA